jgi:hypothetical protein
LGNLLYYPRNYPSLARLIAAVHDGDTSGLGSIMEDMVMEAAESDIADQTAVECRDRPHLRTPLAEDASPFDKIHAGICAEWSNLGPPPVVPVGTTVPTLVLAGQFDPVAGSALSRQVADEIGAHALGSNFRDWGTTCGLSAPAQRASCRASSSVQRRHLRRHVDCGDRRSLFFRNPRNTKEQKSRYLHGQECSPEQYDYTAFRRPLYPNRFHAACRDTASACPIAAQLTSRSRRMSTISCMPAPTRSNAPLYPVRVFSKFSVAMFSGNSGFHTSWVAGVAGFFSFSMIA